MVLAVAGGAAGTTAITVDLAWCGQPQGSQEAGMAQKTAVGLDDDLGGDPADETVRLG
jgi:hypothetical protein